MLYLARHPLLRLAGGWWVVSDPLQHADAIVVLGDDNFSGDRAARAAELFQAGWAPQVVASGRMLRPYAGVADLIARDLQAKGVPAAAIVTFAHHADSTRSEAEALRGLVAQRHWHRILVVTSNYHTRRARYIFRKVFPSDVSISVSPAAGFRLRSRQLVEKPLRPEAFSSPKVWVTATQCGSCGGPGPAVPAFCERSSAHCLEWLRRGGRRPVVSSRSSLAPNVQFFSVYNRYPLYYISPPGPLTEYPLWVSLERDLTPAHTGGFHVAKARTTQIFFPGHRSCCRSSG